VDESKWIRPMEAMEREFGRVAESRESRSARARRHDARMGELTGQKYAGANELK